MWRKISLFLLLSSTALLWLDVFTFQGYLQSIIHLSSKIILLVVFGLSLLTVYLNSNKKFISSQLFSILGLIIFFAYCLLVAIEGSTHQGYIFAHIGCRPESMFVAVLATLWAFATYVTHDFWRYIFIASICFYAIRLTPIVVTQSTVTLREVARAPLASYDQKMSLLWGDFYTHMQEIRRTTAQDSIVTIPSDVKQFPLEGNAALVRYFVYPRTVVVGDPL